MSRSERAWEGLRKDWHPHQVGVDDNPVKASLRRLMGMRLPVAAIDEITALVRAVEVYMLENEWCDACGVRADGMAECSECFQIMPHDVLDSVNGKCEACGGSGECDEEE